MPNIIHKHGFPAGTPEDEAFRAAVEAAKADAASQGMVLDEATVVTRNFTTAEHVAAGEMLVRVDALTRAAE